jgi:hypothetical protein
MMTEVLVAFPADTNWGIPQLMQPGSRSSSSLRRMSATYDLIGTGYARTRREDPVIAATIWRGPGASRSVVNVGAGAGSYEPRDRYVLAVEPSDTMAAQRPRALAPALRLSAGEIPLRDGSIDAAMAVLTLHH